MFKFFINNDILNHQQYGFMCNKSCITNLLETFEDWTSAIDQGCGADVIYSDYSKAFDSVPHRRLIKARGYMAFMEIYLYGYQTFSLTSFKGW